MKTRIELYNVEKVTLIDDGGEASIRLTVDGVAYEMVGTFYPSLPKPSLLERLKRRIRPTGGV